MAENDTQMNNDQPVAEAASRWTTVLMGIAALFATGGFGMLFSLWWQSDAPNAQETLELASRMYVGGRPVVAGDLAKTVELDPEEDAELIPLRDFLIGAGGIARADEMPEENARRRLLHDCAARLSSVATKGFPPGRESEGNRLLGESLYRVGRYDEAAEALRRAINRDRSLARRVLPVLASAELRAPSRAPADSLETVDRYLSDATLTGEQRRDAELVRIRSLLQLDRWADAESTIQQALARLRPAEDTLRKEAADFADQLLLLEAAVAIDRAISRYGARPAADAEEDRSAAKQELAEPLEKLEELQRTATPTVAARARLWMAKALLCQGQLEPALAELTMVRQQRPFGAEGILGGLEEIKLLAGQGRGSEATQTTRYLIRELGHPEHFDPTLITFEEFKQQLRDVIQRLQTEGQYESAIDIARSLPPIFPPGEALVQEGIGYRQWAEATADAGNRGDAEVSPAARQRFRAAGDAFAEAAELGFDTEGYLPALWSAIEAYQQGRHFARSIELLKPYLHYEQRRRRPRGLVAHGRALLAAGDAEEAIDSLTHCIVEHPRDPLRYDARLLAAHAHAELGQLDEARRLLRDNLDDGELTPRSPAWRDSLFTLGELLYRQGYEKHLLAEQATGQRKLDMMRENQPVLLDALRYLNEAVERYWPIPRAVSAAYLTARTHRMAAQWPNLESQSPEILNAAQRALRAKADAALQSALDEFTRLANHLAERDADEPLAEKEQTMLRNCLMGQADTMRMLDRYKDAAEAYQAISLRYMNQPTALEALLAQARCAKALGRKQESELLIRQANLVLQRIPDEWDPRFEEMTRYDREGWEKLLAWMTGRIENPGV